MAETEYLLYHYPLCPFSRKVRVCLYEKGISYDMILEDFWKKRFEFIKMNPAGEAGYRENAEACRKELSALKEEFSLAKQKLAGTETVVFHEGFVYLLRMLGMEAVHCLAMDADTQISAGEAAEIVEECKLHGIAVLFAEAEYVDNISETFGGETESVVVALDALTGGEKSETPIMTYCNGMRNNLNAILQAYGLQ